MKKIDLIISLILVILLLSIFVNKFTVIILFFTLLLLLLLLFKNRQYYFLLLLLCVIFIGFYNYKISENYFQLGYNILSQTSVKQYFLNIISFMVMLYTFSSERMCYSIYNNFRKMKNLLLIIICLAQMFILYLLITGEGFSSLWGMRVFIGPYFSPHQYAYSLIIMCIAIEFIIREKNKRIYNFLYIIPIVTSFLTGARTPMIIMLMIIFIIKVFRKKRSIYSKFKVKNILFFLFLSIIVVVFSSFIMEAILNSTIMSKFNETISSGNLLNSRNYIWEGLLEAYKSFSLKEQLFGHGIYYSVIINRIVVRSEIWGHSDFIDILVSYGGIMLLIYSILYLRYFYYLKQNGMNAILVFGLCITMISLSFFNGVVNYSIFIPIVCYLGILSCSLKRNL